jgi:hypothetical protein
VNQLIEAIQQTLPAVAQEWNTVKLPLFETLVEKSFADYFEGKQTQEKTKLVAPVLDIIFARQVSAVVPEFVIKEGKGQDYQYGSIPFECKITFGIGNNWNGNGYAKAPWHILLRFDMAENGTITHMFATLVNLDNCVSKWKSASKGNTKTVNWYHLVFLKEDLAQLTLAVGEIQQKSKYLQPVMIPVDQ